VKKTLELRAKPDLMGMTVRQYYAFCEMSDLRDEIRSLDGMTGLLVAYTEWTPEDLQGMTVRELTDGFRELNERLQKEREDAVPPPKSGS
jgi:hypothetical protein